MSKQIIAYGENGKNIIFPTMMKAGSYFNLGNTSMTKKLVQGSPVVFQPTGEVFYLDEMYELEEENDRK